MLILLCGGSGPGKPMRPMERSTIRLALPSKGRMAEDTLGLMKVAIYQILSCHVKFEG